MNTSQKRRSLAALFTTLFLAQCFDKAAAQVVECDRLASSPIDTSRPATTEGVATDQIDGPKAVAACERAIVEAPDDPRMKYQLGRALLRIGGQNERAVQLFREAAEKGYAAAQYIMAVASKRGIGVPQDDQEAARLYRRAAEGGILPAIYWLGSSLLSGNGMPKDETEAAIWMSKAAKADHADATNDLGTMYENGHGVPKDPAKARELYERAMQLGSDRGRTNLALTYAYGRGGSADRWKAWSLFNDAIDAKDSDAGDMLGRMIEDPGLMSAPDCQAIGNEPKDERIARGIFSSYSATSSKALKDLAGLRKNSGPRFGSHFFSLGCYSYELSAIETAKACLKDRKASTKQCDDLLAKSKTVRRNNLFCQCEKLSK